MRVLLLDIHAVVTLKSVPGTLVNRVVCGGGGW